MTRIVSGRWGGRRLATPQGRKLRPTAERVREAWFSILEPDLQGAVVLDLFAGTGALGLEALSRGAASVTFVESALRSVTVLRQNVAALEAESGVTIMRDDAFRALDRLIGDGSDAADIVLADPPFDSVAATELARRWLAAPFAGICAIEHASRNPIAGGETREWGDIAVTFFRRS